MNIGEIERELKELVSQPYHADEFVYRFLEIYKAPAASIKKLQLGKDNKSDQDGDLLWRAKLYFSFVEDGETEQRLDSLIESKLTKQNKPRIILTTDGERWSAYDAKACEYRHGDYSKLNDDFVFFFPVAGIDKYEAVEENPADVKAADRLAKLYDAILAENPDWIGEEKRHQLNLFMTRILFCMFAEDTGIFDENVFTKLIKEFGDQSERNIPDVLEKIFLAMNTPEDHSRDGMPKWACDFPYVNGGLFQEVIEIPKFSRKATRTLKEAAQLDWKEINPDIFGSMIQAVVDTEMRGDLGMHYTSVPNIMKVLHPLFLMELEEEFADALGHLQEKFRLQKLLDRISKIRVFDPACGSGNFLIIAYRELRKLEMRIYERQDELNKGQIERRFESVVKLQNFYGIEYADFAAETAKLSLWIVEYQMNKQFKAIFGDAPPALPLNTGGNVCHGNALRVDWKSICPLSDEHETYIAGNPPYLGRGQQTKEQKDDLSDLFSPLLKSYKMLDFVACWYLLAAKYCSKSNATAAFVATNSICQGEQVYLLWPLLSDYSCSIQFAHTPFKWANNAAKKAGVTCVIVGISANSKKPKYLFSEGNKKNVSNISPYLIEGASIYVKPSTTPLSFGHIMSLGNQPTDGGNLILSRDEVAELVAEDPKAEMFVKRYIGSQEFIKGIERYCLWITDDQLDSANSIAKIKDRIAKVAELRSNSPAPTTRAKASSSHKFIQIQDWGKEAIIVPAVSSEKRRYFPAGFLDEKCIISNLAFAVYGAPVYYLALITSRMHAVWAATVSGQLETRIRYGNSLVYNTFPYPNLTLDQKEQLTSIAWQIISIREKYPGKTIAWLYDAKTMPKDLLEAHQGLDDTLEKIYIGRPFKNDTERLEHLFKLYAEMTAN